MSTNSVHLAKAQCSTPVHLRIFTAEYLRKFDNSCRDMDLWLRHQVANPGNIDLGAAERAGQSIG
jgi:uncharacterized protein Smg (DUF494 family)